VLLHEFGQEFRAHPEFAFQGLEPTLLVLDNSGREAYALKSGASFLDKGFPPVVNEHQLNLVLVAHVARRQEHNQMLLQNIHFLFRAEVTLGSFPFELPLKAQALPHLSSFSITA